MNIKEKTYNRSLRLTEERMQALTKISQQLDMPITQLIYQAIDESLWNVDTDPPVGKRLMVSTFDGFVTIGIYDEYWYFDSGNRYNQDQIIAWKPLPKSYN